MKKETREVTHTEDVWVATDGTTFNVEWECQEYESKMLLEGSQCYYDVSGNPVDDYGDSDIVIIWNEKEYEGISLYVAANSYLPLPKCTEFPSVLVGDKDSNINWLIKLMGNVEFKEKKVCGID